MMMVRRQGVGTTPCRKCTVEDPRPGRHFGISCSSLYLYCSILSAVGWSPGPFLVYSEVVEQRGARAMRRSILFSLVGVLGLMVACGEPIMTDGEHQGQPVTSAPALAESSRALGASAIPA